MREINDMQYEYKIVPLNRKTGAPAFASDDLNAQFTVDIRELYRTLEAVNPLTNAGALPALVLSAEDDTGLLTHSLARMLSEMFGANIYFRPVGGEEWTLQPGNGAFALASGNARATHERKI